jgi:hypothetical protein
MLQPPKLTQPGNNTIVRFTTLHQNFGQPLVHPSNNLTYSQLIGTVPVFLDRNLALLEYYWDSRRYVTSSVR